MKAWTELHYRLIRRREVTPLDTIVMLMTVETVEQRFLGLIHITCATGQLEQMNVELNPGSVAAAFHADLVRVERLGIGETFPVAVVFHMT